MMKKIIFSSLLLLVSFSSFSQTKDKFDLFATSDNYMFYFKLINNTETTKEIWYKIIEINDSKTVLMNLKMDCNNKTYSISNLRVDDGTNEYKETSGLNNKYNVTIKPESPEEKLYKILCGNN